MTAASVNFQAVKSAVHAVSHANRSVPPTYLLPAEMSMGTIVVKDDHGAVHSTLEKKRAMASRQALRSADYSPVWEGVLNLRRPEIDEDKDAYRDECKRVVEAWCERYQQTTGHTVLRADVHLDEGHIVDNVALLNAHAHIIADRTNDAGRVIKLAPKQLRELQTMTAEITQLERGKPARETGKKHISHHAYKHLAERGNLEVQQLKKELSQEREKSATLAQSIDQLKAAYAADRAALKASGEATQAAYSALKKAHEAALKAVTELTKKREAEKHAEPTIAHAAKYTYTWEYTRLEEVRADLDAIEQDQREVDEQIRQSREYLRQQAAAEEGKKAHLQRELDAAKAAALAIAAELKTVSPVRVLRKRELEAELPVAQGRARAAKSRFETFLAEVKGNMRGAVEKALEALLGRRTWLKEQAQPLADIVAHAEAYTAEQEAAAAKERADKAQVRVIRTEMQVGSDYERHSAAWLASPQKAAIDRERDREKAPERDKGPSTPGIK